MKHIKKIFVFIMILILAYFVLGELFLVPDISSREYRCEEFSGTWNLLQKDGTKTPIDIPGKYDVARNEKLTVETILPTDIPHNSYLCFRSAKQEMNIYVDGILRKEYTTKDTRLFGKISAVAYVFLELTPEDAGKELTLEVQTASAYSGIFYTVYFGNRIGIWSNFLENYGAELIVAFIALALGIISIFAGIIVRINYHKEIVFEYLGWGVFLAAIWLIANSIFRQLISPNLSVINDMAFMALMLLPMPFLIYMNGIQKNRYKKLYELAGFLIIIDFIVCTILHIIKLVDYTDTIQYMVTVSSLSLIIMGIGIAADIKNRHIKEYFWVSIGILASVVAAFIQMAMYFQRTTTFSGAILATGLILLLVFAAVNTIHEILQMEIEKQKAILASESKGKFLANMSHEIRTPINAILGMNAMILRESTDSKIKEYAIDIQNASQSLLALINDILDFSKIESGKLELLPIEYDFSSMIHDIINMISMKAEAKDLKVDLYVDQDLPSRLWGDDVRIRQILINLLNNAVKYTEKGSVTLRVTGNITEDMIVLHFTVEDTGIGIREEDIAKLFEDFKRIDEERNRHIEGTGLGMSIAVQLLEMMESKLQVESVYGHGSTFSFQLKQKIVDKEPIGNLEERIRQQATDYSYNAMFTAPEAEILVVDDNPVNRKVFINLLKATKVKIDGASSGQECLEMICQKRYDVIFMDHMMPEMDGVETFHYMKKETNHLCLSTPVIALTANAIAGAKEMYLSEGFNDFISKPINPEKLEKLLVKLLPKEKIIYEKQNTLNLQKKENKLDLPEIDGIDWEYALLHTKDVDILLATVKDYYYTIDTEADELEHFFRQILVEQDNENISTWIGKYRIKVHSMKNSAALIGATSLSGVAKMLEYAAKEERKDVIEKVTFAFLEYWRSYKELLKICLQNENSIAKKELDYKILGELLHLMKEAMDDMDIDTADNIIDQLDNFHYPDDMLSNIEKLKTAVTNIDAMQVLECVEAIEKQM